MKTPKQKNSDKNWLKPHVSPTKPRRIIGVDLDKLDSKSIDKFIALMDELKYEPFNVANDSATAD